jgi:hypothetical protein
MNADSADVDVDHCDDVALARALVATEHLIRRPRRLQAEFHRAWIRAVAFSEMRASDKKDAAVVAARDRLGASERTVWTALAPAPAAPTLDRERILRIFAANIRIAEESGNRRAAEFLRRQLKRFETRAIDL